MWAPSPVPNDVKQLPGYLRGEFERIRRELQPQAVLQLAVSYVEPDRPRDGMIVLADATGANWNPGAGAGFYGRYGGAWIKLG